MNLFKFNYIPLNKDLGLLLLRIAFGFEMIYGHGWKKLINYDTRFHSFPDVIGIGSEASYILVTYFECFGALAVILGLYARFHALGLAIVMLVAFVVSHDMLLIGSGNGEKPFLYFFGFLLIFLNGAGKYSIDRKTGVRS
ncbi:DoxX family protein [Urechidicola vernalis]|uniref:DoxX family protein n=1 Tax=Urechidicola vernalis TaxID=3075600 RepID=A0ABU2Y7T6_9FLAO|nr:DoxX family protein [Urechidicola sp. P050]MDT0553860.1 DoxX family protein [Urechidicola sp. P050]